MVNNNFKAIYFPREKTRSGKSVRVSVYLSKSSHEIPLNYVKSLSSRDFRLAMGNPFLEDLEAQAQLKGTSFSDVCLTLIKQFYKAETAIQNKNGNTDEQLELSLAQNTNKREKVKGSLHNDIGITFKESLHQGIHGWYPYVEGFSATYVRDTILRGTLPRTIYDPFGGSGTTSLAASALGIPSFYSEINPFMAFVAETKVNVASWAHSNLEVLNELCNEYVHLLHSRALENIDVDKDIEAFERAFPKRDFFESIHLRHLLAARELAKQLTENSKEVRSLLLLACASNAVLSSNMTRRADLRRRRSDEYRNRVVDVPTLVSNSVQRIVRDISQLLVHQARTTKVSDDCRSIPISYGNSFDLAITSPPYLNGTNYFRNTKIELWLAGFIETEKELKSLRSHAITAGINNVSVLKKEYTKFEGVEEVARKLDVCAKDKRIPSLVRHYFSDMKEVMSSVLFSLVPGGRFFLDIGDSKFYGVHVETDRLIAEVAKSVGFEVEHKKIIAKRYSRDKTELIQAEFLFKKTKKNSFQMPAKKQLIVKKDRISNFANCLPYKQIPYSSRSWGHKLHSLCSYQGKLKPSLAYWLVKEFTNEDSVILDPLGGVGTVAFEGALRGNLTVSNDKSPFASTIASAKLNPPSLEDASKALESLRLQMKKIELTEEDFAAARFGLNATVEQYYHPETLEEILKARKIFLKKRDWDAPEMFIWASLLHVLHGNRPYALSRTSHPITPLHPKGEAIYKSTVEKVRAKVERALKEPLSTGFKPGLSIFGDFRDLPKKCNEPFDAIITSPPFLGMRFDRPNWLRMWFCGWNAVDFHKTSLSFLERQQTKSMNCYQDFFEVCNVLLKPNGILIVHLGSGDQQKMIRSIKEIASHSYKLIYDLVENVQSIEQHGIRDKGYTKSHHLLFFQPRY